MKLKKFPTIKAAILGAAALSLAGCNLPKSSEVVQAKIGQSLDAVIADWGYPARERKVAGRTLVIWEESELSYDNVPQIGVSVPVGTNGSVTATIPLGEPEEKVCRRTLELNKSDIVIGASLQGDLCPYYAPNNW